MRLIVIILLLCCLNITQGVAQDTQPGEWITVNLDMTDSMTTTIGYDVKSKLATKVLSVVSRNGRHSKISCVRNKSGDPSKIDLGDLNTGILCKPKLEIFDEEMLETGMEKIMSVHVSLSIFIQSVQGNVIFASTTKDYQGTGKDRRSAINNAITNIKVRDKTYENFLKEARAEVVRYYNQMCSTILEQAKTLTAFKKHTEAIYLLWPIPNEVECHKEARENMITIYKEFVEYRCDNLLYDAKTFITNKDFGKAMLVLRQIDAQASCAGDAITLMGQIAAKVDEQERLYIDLYKKMRENDFELEKERYRAMGNITKNFNQTKIEIEEK